MSIPTKSLEFLMESSRWHSKTGFHVTFLVNAHDEEFFKACPDGTRFQAVLVKLTDADTPAPLPTPADLAKEEKKRAAKAEADAKGFDAAVERVADAHEAAKQPAILMDNGGSMRGVMEANQAAKQPAKQRFPDGLCGLAVRWCADEHFQAWIGINFPDEWRKYSADAKSEEICAKHVLAEVCGILSRKELDTSDVAADNFKSNILKPYSLARAEDGVDDDDESDPF